MKRILMAFTAIAALAGPLSAPIQALAQESQSPRRERPSSDRRGGPGAGGGERQIAAPQASPRPQRPSRPSGGGERPQAPNARPARPDADQARPSRPQRPSGGSQRPGAGQNRPDRPNRPEGGQHPGGDRPNRPDRPGGGWNQNDRPNRPNRPEGSWSQNNRPDRPGGGWNRDNRPNRPDRPNGGWNNGRNDRPNRPDRPNGGWNQGGRDRHEDFRRRFNGDQWRRDFQRTHRNDWWRNDRRFRGYTGVRIGFYFAPGWGYYSVPQSYWHRTWRIGDYLPDIFWRYRLDDWRTYGLGFPPEGARWVLVDNTIYLIDEYDGYIIDVIYNAWSW